MPTPHFALDELRAASDRAPTRAELLRFDAQLGWPVLEPMRLRWGWIDLTSWLRDGSAAHSSGRAVDIQPRSADPWDVFAWGARHLRGAIGKMIYEPPEPHQHRAHLHIVTPGPEVWAGYGELWIEEMDGSRRRYVPVTEDDIAGLPAAPATAAASIAGLLAVGLLVRGLSE